MNISRLQTVRNTFIHQHPSGYVFTSNELVELIRISVDIVVFLVNESERLALNGHTESQIKDLLGKLSTQLTRDYGVNS